jgi:hypothetical protein
MPTPKTKSIACALALILISASLIGCATASSASKPSSALMYQPRVLRLPAQVPVQTLDGIYTPQNAETWHSPAEFSRAEQQALDAASALAQERARK